jgi:glycosyltransferase involved in cell wall biosynthesis
MTDDLVYGVTSDSIRSLFPLGRRVFLMPNGVEPSHFKYTERDGRIRTLGWCGAPHVWFKQTGWAHEISKKTNIPLSIGEGMTFEQIADWYGTVDILVITSIPNGSSETGPLPAFEAIVSGVLVIGTPVGNFKQIPGPKFHSIDEAVSLIEELRNDPKRVNELAREQYESVMEHHTYSSFAYRWQDALEYVASR